MTVMLIYVQYSMAVFVVGLTMNTYESSLCYNYGVLV